MAGFILVDVKTKKTVAICMAIALVLFAIGIVIGYFSRQTGSTSTDNNPGSVADAIRSSCSSANINAGGAGETYFKRFLERHDEKHACVNTPGDCADFGLPRNYIAYHLKDKTINIDGVLDDDAWKEVPWTENFVDMRSNVYPAPYYNTKVKLRWDDNRMYIGAYIQEKNLWATMEVRDSKIYQENGFEMLMDVDGTMFNYKQLQINVLGTMMDQILYKSPHDVAVKDDVKVKEWHGEEIKAVHADGTVNQPGDDDKFWSFEMSITFNALAERSERVTPDLIDNEVWFIQFGRSEQKLIVEDGQYKRKPNSTTDWWSWQPCDAINLHLQDRWGLVQFKRDITDKKFLFQKWHIYKALFDMMNAMKKYKALHARYVDTIEELDVPPYLLSRTCVDIPEINLITNGTLKDFDVSVKSMHIQHKPAHIRSDRYVWFE